MTATPEQLLEIILDVCDTSHARDPYVTIGAASAILRANGHTSPREKIEAARQAMAEQLVRRGEADKYQRVYDYARIPEGISDAINAWIKEGQAPGDTVAAILRNDLRAAFERADVHTADAMPAIMSWLYNRAPMHSWGSPDAVEFWRSAHAERRARELVGRTPTHATVTTSEGTTTVPITEESPGVYSVPVTTAEAGSTVSIELDSIGDGNDHDDDQPF